MKFIHISDLHLGKYIHGYSMVDNNDQGYWIKQFIDLVIKEKPDAILMAGDIYDRSIAPKEAIKLFDSFINDLSKLEIPLMIIAGNHDSGVRLSAMSEIIAKHHIYIAGEVKAKLDKVVLKDEYGEVNFYLVPYLFPASVSQVLGVDDLKIKDYSEAFKMLLDNQDIDYTKRNVIISHQLVTSNNEEVSLGGSEEMVGGVGAIDVSLYKDFDYAALGHIHKAQAIKYPHVRYAGSILNYHFDEIKCANKGPVIVELKEKGQLDIRIEQIKALHPLRQVEGTLEEIIESEKTIINQNEYIKVILKDDFVPLGAINTLEAIFNSKHSLLLETAHKPARIYNHDINDNEKIKELSLEEAFTLFYKEKNNGEYPSENDAKLIDYLAMQVSNSEDYESLEDSDIDKLIECAMRLED